MKDKAAEIVARLGPLIEKSRPIAQEYVELSAKKLKTDLTQMEKIKLYNAAKWLKDVFTKTSEGHREAEYLLARKEYNEKSMDFFYPSSSEVLEKIENLLGEKHQKLENILKDIRDNVKPKLMAELDETIRELMPIVDENSDFGRSER